MKPFALLILPWLAAAAWAGQTQPARVLFAHQGSDHYRGFRVEDECFVPLNALSSAGWEVEARGGEAEITAEGETFRLPIRLFDGVRTVALRRAVAQVGGSTEWVLNTNRIEVYAPLRTVEVRQGRLTVESPLSLRPRVAHLANPSRVVVDLPGSRLVRRTRTRLDRGARATQVATNVVRLEIEVSGRTQLPQSTIEPTRKLELDMNPLEGAGGAGLSGGLSEEDPASGDAIPRLDLPTPKSKPPAAPLLSGPLSVSVELEGPLTTVLTVRAGRPLSGSPALRKPSPDVLEVILPGVSLELPDGFRLGTESVNDLSVRTSPAGTVLKMTLPRPMGAQVNASSDAVRIELLKPRVGNGRLTGKIVVVDPGHGGKAGGATRNGVMEKTLTLSISKLLATNLAEQGATVIMTRKTDIDVGLNERAAIATRNGADFFLSVHINSNARTNSTSGSITFHHKGVAVSKLLAECIQNEIARVSKLPSIGVWSDGRIYDSGFAVLRKTKMPGVLLELGFINHDRDRARMQEPQFQRAVAAAIVKGVRVFLGDVEPSK